VIDVFSFPNQFLFLAVYLVGHNLSIHILRQKIVATLNVFLHSLKIAEVIEAKMIYSAFVQKVHIVQYFAYIDSLLSPNNDVINNFFK
jgi:hypothetical protein